METVQVVASIDAQVVAAAIRDAGADVFNGCLWLVAGMILHASLS